MDDPDARRRDVHDRARAAIDELAEPAASWATPDGCATFRSVVRAPGASCRSAVILAVAFSAAHAAQASMPLGDLRTSRISRSR